MALVSDQEIHSPATEDGGCTTAVAIDKDKNSPYAVRWAIENILPKKSTIYLIHVSNLSSQNDSVNLHEVTSAANGGVIDSDSPQVFVPYRVYCSRKQVTVKEIVLDEADVSKALLNYINTHFTANIVLGASNRSALTKKFKNHDVSTILNKYAPDFCSVYVIAKGKAQSVRPATRPALNSATPPKQSSPRVVKPHPLPDYGQPAEMLKPTPSKARVKLMDSPPGSTDSDEIYSETKKNSSTLNLLGEESGFITPPLRSSSADLSSKRLNSINTTPGQYASIDISTNDLDLTNTAEPVKATTLKPNDLEATMKRLKQDLKQTMTMYNNACKEAMSAKKKTEELHMWKMEEAKRFEQARLAEEAALAIVEKEKAKSKAAMEAAEKAQKLAELEAQRRKYAEMKAKREAEERKRALEVLSNNDVRYRKFTIEEIEAATDRFSASLKVGEGGYGPVYKAKLDHTPVAIKVLRPNAKQGRKQFKQEVEILSCIRHPNMVLLLGACPEYGCLVYEYMNYGSLKDRLFRKGNTPSLPWRTRFQISADIATGLLFLHQTKPEPLVHRDLKPANILLDRNFVCKISDVGLARLVPPSVADSVTQYHMTSAAGTFCYIDPEYQQTGKLGTKSDVYSLGVMLLQVITARPPMSLSHQVEKAIEKGNFAELLDPSVPDWPVEEALAFAKISLKCCELRKRDRPDLCTVILPELNRIAEFGRKGEGYGTVSPCSVQLSPGSISPQDSSDGNQDHVSGFSPSSCFSLSAEDHDEKK